MSKPMIWVDCDGVMADFCRAYLGLLCEVTGREHTFDQVTHFNFSECVAGALTRST